MVGVAPIISGRSPIVSYNWLEWLQGWGMLTLYAGVFPAKTTKYEYLEGARAGSKTQDTAAKMTAQTFTVGTVGTNEDFYATKIWFDLHSNPQILGCQIRETTAGAPNSTVLASYSIGSATIMTDNDAHTLNPTWYEFCLTGGSSAPKLLAGQTYALVLLQITGATTALIGYSSAYAGGGKYDSTDTGANWTADGANDLLFKVFGQTVCPMTLSSQTITSVKGSTAIYVTNTSDVSTWTALPELFFESVINKSAILQGTAYLNFGLTKGANLLASYGEIDLIHVDRAGTETVIGEAQTFSNDTTGVQIELTRTKVSPGEKIKLKFNFYYTQINWNVTGSNVTITHSGSNMILHLPFRTDL